MRNYLISWGSGWRQEEDFFKFFFRLSSVLNLLDFDVKLDLLEVIFHYHFLCLFSFELNYRGCRAPFLIIKLHFEGFGGGEGDANLNERERGGVMKQLLFRN